MFKSAAYFLVFLMAVVVLSAPAHASKRVALVIGNSAYKHATPLVNPKNDAEAVSAVLEELGFEVVTGIDLSHVGFAETVGKFRRKLQHADVALFFYAGHGLQVNGQNYLAPVDSRLEDETALAFEAVKLRTILSLMERRPRTNIVFLDACRDNPLAQNLARSMGTRSGAIGRGLARVESGVGTLITFATQPGNVALDGDEENSPFTQSLVRHISTPGLDVALMIRRVRQDVIDLTGGRQIPWQHSSLTAPFLFKKSEAVAAVVTKPQPKSAEPLEQLKQLQQIQRSQQPQGLSEVEREFWNATRRIGSAEVYALYLQQFPKGKFAALARLQIKMLAKPITPVEEPSDTLDSRELALAVQRELNRVGCNLGRPDGNWGRKSREAMARFNEEAGLDLPTTAPSLEAVDALKQKAETVCAAPTVVKRKPKPVKKKTASKPRATPAPRPVARKKRKSSFESMANPERCSSALGPSSIGGGAGGC